MPFHEKTGSFSGGFLLSAMAAWAFSAGILLCMAALAADISKVGETSLAYFSSALSFLTAAAAGLAAARHRKAGGLVTALASSTTIVILLLTLGFLIRGEKLDPSAVLSVVSFTYAGCLFGACLLYKPMKKNGKQLFHRRN